MQTPRRREPWRCPGCTAPNGPASMQCRKCQMDRPGADRAAIVAASATAVNSRQPGKFPHDASARRAAALARTDDTDQLWLTEGTTMIPAQLPKRGEWLDVHRSERAGQTLQQFLGESRAVALPAKVRRKIVLVPLDGEETPPYAKYVMNRRMLSEANSRMLREFLRAYLQFDDTDVVLAQRHSMTSLAHEGGAGCIRTRTDTNSDNETYLQHDIAGILNNLVKLREADRSAYCVVAFTASLLYNSKMGAEFKYQSGCALLHGGAAVLSFFTVPCDLPSLRFGAMSIMAHEVCHTFGIKHCAYYHNCFMRGSAHHEEGLTIPLQCCPVELAKLAAVVNVPGKARTFDAMKRYRELRAFYTKYKMNKEREFIDRRLHELGGGEHPVLELTLKSYKELQAMAKALGIRANGKKSAIVAALEAHAQGSSGGDGGELKSKTDADAQFCEQAQLTLAAPPKPPAQVTEPRKTGRAAPGWGAPAATVAATAAQAPAESAHEWTQPTMPEVYGTVSDECHVRHVRAPLGTMLAQLKRSVLAAYGDQYQPHQIKIFTRMIGPNDDKLAEVDTDSMAALLTQAPRAAKSTTAVLLIVSAMNSEENELLVMRDMRAPITKRDFGTGPGAVVAMRLARTRPALFKPLPLPTHRDDWLAQHRESAENVAGLMRRPWRKALSFARRVVYVLPLQTVDGGGGIAKKSGCCTTTFAAVRAYLGAFFHGVSVKLLPTLCLHVDRSAQCAVVADAPSEGSRTVRWRDVCPFNGHRCSHGQLQAKDVLRLCKQRLPSDAFCVLGLTMADLYCGDDDEFVGGLASLSERAGVFSLHRNTAETKTGESVLSSACKTAAHEIMHMFGIGHCVHRHCLMNGSGHVLESRAAPHHLCPIDLAKLLAVLGPATDAVQRYEKLSKFCETHGAGDEQLKEYSQWLQRAASAVRESSSDSHAIKQGVRLAVCDENHVPNVSTCATAHTKRA